MGANAFHSSSGFAAAVAVAVAAGGGDGDGDGGCVMVVSAVLLSLLVLSTIFAILFF